MRKAALVSIVAGVAVLSCSSRPCRAQGEGGVYGGVQSFGFSSSYSATSSHIFLGDAEHRRIWTLGAEYTRFLYRGARIRVDYEGSIVPLYEETDPTLIGATFTLNGQVVTTSQTPLRVTHVNNGQVSTLVIGTNPGIPIFAVFGRQDTYAAAIAPLGVRVSGWPRWRLQPGFALDLGFVVSARDIPVDDTDQFNYMFDFGPGLEFFTDHRTSWRVEYLYRHVSNAGQGNLNPGVDQGVVRVTLSVHP